jgi:FixJ family two-component response regulator
MGTTGRVLIVDDEESIRYTCKDFLQEEGYRVAAAIGYDDAVALTSSSSFDLVFIDVILDGRSGLEVLKEIKRRSPDTEAVIITGVPSIESAAQAMRLGALDYIMKPLRQDALLEATETAFRHRAERTSGDPRRSNLETIFDSIGDAVIAVDDELSIVESNGAAERLCGIRCNDAVGTLLEGWLCGCAGACLQPLRDAVASGRPVRLHHVECRTDRRPHQVVDVVATPLTAPDGTGTGGVLVIREQFTA